MGHLTKIANEIVAVVEKGDNSELVKEYIRSLNYISKVTVKSYSLGVYFRGYI
jgi:hypothetical protein